MKMSQCIALFVVIFCLWLFVPIHGNTKQSKHSQVSTYTIGSYTRGCIQNPERLPPEGFGYQTVRFSRQRLFGHPSLIQFIKNLAQQAQSLWNDNDTDQEKTSSSNFSLGVGDLSGEVGGPSFDNHRSHQNGLEVDILYLPILSELNRSDREKMPWPSFVDLDKKQTNERFTRKQELLLFYAAQSKDVDRIFVHAAIVQSLCKIPWFHKEALQKIRPWYGHADHFHVRLKCPKDSSTFCHPQASPPSTEELCGNELQSWLYPKESEIPKTKSTIKRKARPYEPDPQCKTLLAHLAPKHPEGKTIIQTKRLAQNIRARTRKRDS